MYNIIMKSLDYTLERLPGNQLEHSNASLPLGNPKPILQQTKSNITTNPFIKETGVDIPYNPTFNQINEHVSVTFVGLLDDMFNKPDNESWNSYLPKIVSKDNRYNYIAVLIFFIALYILLIK
jgi:hypothetical protein